MIYKTEEEKYEIDGWINNLMNYRDRKDVDSLTRQICEADTNLLPTIGWIFSDSSCTGPSLGQSLCLWIDAIWNSKS